MAKSVEKFFKTFSLSWKKKGFFYGQRGEELVKIVVVVGVGSDDELSNSLFFFV